MIYLNYSRPEPNTETESKVRARLKEIDSLLDIVWAPYAVYNEAHKQWEGRYTLICKWPEVDSRWKMYESGEIGEPYDSLGWFCTDIHDAYSTPVDADSIENKVLELLYKCDNTKQSWKVRMAELVEKNAQIRKARAQEVLDQTQDIAEVLFQAVGRHKQNKVEGIMKELGEN